jgi:hypothetical protein
MLLWVLCCPLLQIKMCICYAKLSRKHWSFLEVYTFGFQNKVQGHATNQIRTPSTSKYIHWFFVTTLTILFYSKKLYWRKFECSLYLLEIIKLSFISCTLHMLACLYIYICSCWCVGCNYTKILSFFFPVVLNLAYVLLKFETVTYGCRMSNCQGLQSPATTYILVDAQTSSNKKNDAWWWSIRANWLV